MSKQWEVVEVGVDEWFFGRREGATAGDGYSPFEEVGHGPAAKECATMLAVFLNAQDARILELDERLKRLEAMLEPTVTSTITKEQFDAAMARGEGYRILGMREA